MDNLSALPQVRVYTHQYHQGYSARVRNYLDRQSRCKGALSPDAKHHLEYMASNSDWKSSWSLSTRLDHKKPSLQHYLQLYLSVLVLIRRYCSPAVLKLKFIFMDLARSKRELLSSHMDPVSWLLPGLLPRLSWHHQWLSNPLWNSRQKVLILQWLWAGRLQ